MIRSLVLVAGAALATATSVRAQARPQTPPTAAPAAPAGAQAPQPVPLPPARPMPAAPTDTSPPLPQEILAIEPGQMRVGLLESGDWTMGDGTWADVWYIQLTVGQRVVIELRSREFDAYLQLLDPAGAKLMDDDDSAGSSNARITFVARETGRHQIIVNNFSDEPDTGRYTLAAGTVR